MSINWLINSKALENALEAIGRTRKASNFIKKRM